MTYTKRNVYQKAFRTLNHHTNGIYSIPTSTSLSLYPKQIEEATIKRTKRRPVYLLFLILKMSLHCPRLRLVLFLYKRKLTMYNLTAITTKKQGYCIYGLRQCRKRHRKRAGNDMASAFICILNKIASDEPHINNKEKFLHITGYTGIS